MDDEEKKNYKVIYDSKVKGVSGIGNLNENGQKQRTESFKETLDFSDFKKEQKKKNGKLKQVATT